MAHADQVIRDTRRALDALAREVDPDIQQIGSDGGIEVLSVRATDWPNKARTGQTEPASNVLTKLSLIADISPMRCSTLAARYGPTSSFRKSGNRLLQRIEPLTQHRANR